MSTNVRVAVRLRPMSTSETARGSLSCVTLQSTTSLSIHTTEKAEEPKAYTFDFAYGGESTQNEVFQDLGIPLVNRALDGYNGTIFAYGQTGTGKTWTMMGIPEDEGLVPLINRELFKRIEEGSGEKEEGTKVKFLVTASYIEIYNEVVKDLLNPSERQLQIRESPDKGVYVQDVCEVICHDAPSILKLLTQGGAVRRVAATQMNQQSSRSHSVFTIMVEKSTIETNAETTKETLLSSKLNLVDLAGSERADKTGATGSTLKEGASINKSLMALGNVINALGKANGASAHIPYRDSKLTRLLQESLGGNASTLMMAALSPADYNYQETLSTLNYAKRAKMIENKVERNEDVNEKMIRELKEEIEALRAKLFSNKDSGGASTNSEVDEKTKERLKQLESSEMDRWEEKERLSKELEAERANNMNVVMGSVIEHVKSKKIEAMKAIKKMQNDKERNLKARKKGKDEYATMKKGLEKRMTVYNTMQTSFEAKSEGEEKDKEEEEMADLLDIIEKSRGTLVTNKTMLQKLKIEGEELEDQLLVQRGELVANAEILDQNDSLRKAIVEEERAKFEEIKDQYLKTELENERKKMDEEKAKIVQAQGLSRKEMILRLGKLQVNLKKEQSGMEALLNNKVDMLENEKKENQYEIKGLKADLEAMETRVVDAESSAEDCAQELISLRASVGFLENKLSSQETSSRLNSARLDEDAEYNVVGFMMDGFNEERKGMERLNKELKAVLNEASGDCVFLKRQVEGLKEYCIINGLKPPGIFKY